MAPNSGGVQAAGSVHASNSGSFPARTHSHDIDASPEHRSDTGVHRNSVWHRDGVSSRWGPIKSLALNAKRRICLDVLRALSYMHNRTPHACIHRDVKPRNILFTPSGSAKVADLGLSKLISVNEITTAEDGTHSKEVGTERYAAPESKSSTYNAKVDIYSSGVVFYELYESVRFEKILEWAMTPARFRRIIADMVEESPSKRPTALQAYDAFDAISTEQSCCVLV